MIPFMGITYHYVADDWSLQSGLLDFCHLPGSHTGENIANCFMQSLKKRGIPSDKVMGVVVDNAKNNDSFVEKLIQLGVLQSEEHHIRCLAHIINLACQDMLEMISESIKSLRIGIKAVRASPQRLERLKRFCLLEGVKFRKPILDVKTMWNATYYMLEVAYHLRPSLSKVFKELEKNPVSSLESDTTITSFQGVTEEDWELMSEILCFLKKFKMATLLCNGETYPTLSTMMPTFDDLLDHCEAFGVKQSIICLSSIYIISF
jgi:hypothetical protein